MIVIENKDPFEFSTHTSFYNSLMNDEPLNGDSNYSTKDYYKFEKGVEGHIEYMTASEYLDQCSSYVFGGDAYKGVIGDKVLKYAEDIRSGDKFPLPYLNFSSVYGPSQEGRHRMLASAKVYGEDEKFPVLVVTGSDPTDKEIMEYAKKKLPSDPQWAFNYVKSKFSKEEVEEEPELDPLKIDAIFIEEGEVCDFGDGLVRVNSIRLSGRSDIVFSSTSLDTGDSVEYVLDDRDKVTVYTKDRNPNLYK